MGIGRFLAGRGRGGIGGLRGQFQQPQQIQPQMQSLQGWNPALARQAQMPQSPQQWLEQQRLGAGPQAAARQQAMQNQPQQQQMQQPQWSQALAQQAQMPQLNPQMQQQQMQRLQRMRQSDIPSSRSLAVQQAPMVSPGGWNNPMGRSTFRDGQELAPGLGAPVRPPQQPQQMQQQQMQPRQMMGSGPSQGPQQTSAQWLEEQRKQQQMMADQGQLPQKGSPEDNLRKRQLSDQFTQKFGGSRFEGGQMVHGIPSGLGDFQTTGGGGTAATSDQIAEWNKPGPALPPGPGTYGVPSFGSSGGLKPGFAQPPSPPSPYLANAPRPQPQQISSGPMNSAIIGAPSLIQPQSVETIAPPAPQPAQDDWGSGSPQELPTAAVGGGEDEGGGPPTSWKMSIEPMAYGGMIPGYRQGGTMRPHERARKRRRGIAGLGAREEARRMGEDLLDFQGLESIGIPSDVTQSRWSDDLDDPWRALSPGEHQYLGDIISDQIPAHRGAGLMSREIASQMGEDFREDVGPISIPPEWADLGGVAEEEIEEEKSLGEARFRHVGTMRPHERARARRRREAQVGRSPEVTVDIGDLTTYGPDFNQLLPGMSELPGTEPSGNVIGGLDTQPPPEMPPIGGLATQPPPEMPPIGGVATQPPPEMPPIGGVADQLTYGQQPTGTSLTYSADLRGGIDYRHTDSKTEQKPQGVYRVTETYTLPDGTEIIETGESTNWNIARGIARSRAIAQVAASKAGVGRAYGGIIGLAGGGYIPMYAGGGIPGYGWGGFFRGLGKVVSKVAPIAMNFIPGLSNLSGVAKAGIGALTQGVGDLSSGKGFNLQSMLGGAGRAYAASSALDRIKGIEGLKGEGLWGGLGKVLTDQNVGKEAIGALANIPFGEAAALGVTEAAGRRGAEQQAADAGGFGGMPGMGNPMGTAGRVMPGSGVVDPTGGYASQMAYGQQPINYAQSDGGLIPEYRRGGRTKKDKKRGGRKGIRRPEEEVGFEDEIEGFPYTGTPPWNVGNQIQQQIPQTYAAAPYDPDDPEAYMRALENKKDPGYEDVMRQRISPQSSSIPDPIPPAYQTPTTPYIAPYTPPVGVPEGEENDPDDPEAYIRALKKRKLDTPEERQALANEEWMKSEASASLIGSAAPIQAALKGEYDPAELAKQRAAAEAAAAARAGQIEPPPPPPPPPPLAGDRTGRGSGFSGEQRWFDPNAPAPVERDIGGFNPHELPRTSADFAAAGDAGGADLLSRLNAPAAPVQDYLSPAPAPVPAPVPGAAEGGLIGIDQIPTERLEELVVAAQQIESPGSQEIIKRAIEEFGIDAIKNIITMIQQQGPMTAPDGAVPGYGIGGFLKKLAKVATFGPTQLLPKKIRDPINKLALKAAPVAAQFLPIPGAGPLLSAGVGVVARGIEGKIDADRARDAAAAVPQAPQGAEMGALQPQQASPAASPALQPPQRYMPNPVVQQGPVQQGIAGQMIYGQEGLNRGGLINGGGGDAMADDILVNAEMANNGGTQPIAVSAGEYIVPGDVLAHLGSGNSEEGGEVMDQFLEDVRVQRTGSPEQPPPIDLRDVLPGTYGERYG